MMPRCFVQFFVLPFLASVTFSNVANAASDGCLPDADFADFGVRADGGQRTFGGPLIRIRRGGQSYISKDRASCVWRAGEKTESDADGKPLALAADVYFRTESLSVDLTSLVVSNKGSEQAANDASNDHGGVFRNLARTPQDPNYPTIEAIAGDNYRCYSIIATAVPQRSVFCDIPSLSKKDAPVVASCGIGRCELVMPVGEGLIARANWTSPSPSLDERAEQAEEISTRVYEFLKLKIRPAK